MKVRRAYHILEAEHLSKVSRRMESQKSDVFAPSEKNPTERLQVILLLIVSQA